VSSPERFGAYLVYEQLGAGGMATVHRAERTNKDGSRTQVALKRLLPAVATNRHLVEAFAAEARLLRYLDHSNIAQTYDHGKVVGGSYFIAMEYVPGPTLKELVPYCREAIGNVPNDVALDLAAQICDALDHAHTRCDEHDTPLSIIHRDVCPANIMLSDTGFVKLIDFGLAKAKRTRTPDTAKGIVKGKMNYVAPEYLDGELDARADLWATGVVLYEMLTTRRLFDGPHDFETLERVRNLPIPRPSLANPLVSAELDEIVMTALQRDPARRWQSAALMRDALRGVQRPGKVVDYHDIADWLRQLYAGQAPRPSRAELPQVVPVASPAASRSLAHTIARGARRLLRRPWK
jgi:serine/threonine protein kinase